MSISGFVHAPPFHLPAGQEPPAFRPAALRHGIDLDALRRVLCDLGQVDHLRDLGVAGPLLASAGTESHFHALFGRDAIRMAFDLLVDFPRVAEATLLSLARLQGVGCDPRVEEEPGRIIRENRSEEEPGRIIRENRPEDDSLRSELERVGSLPSYGAVDSTPQWITLLAAYTARVGDAILDAPIVDRLGRQVSVFDCLLAALGWIVGRLNDPVGGGYLWARRAGPDGIAGQVWDDSSDSYYHADGTVFDDAAPYAPVAVQGYAYDALLGAAEIVARRASERGCGAFPLDALQGIAPPAVRLQARAANLRRAVLRDFWQADIDTFALALTFDAPGTELAGVRARSRPARVVASSPGHLLASRLLDGNDVARIRERLVLRLFEPDLLAGAGIRTRSTAAPRFASGSHHNGSTWPMDTGVIADGLRRHGYDRLAESLEARILAACAQVGGFPECFRGNEDGRIAVNRSTIDELVNGALHRLEQPPHANQGWTATRVWRIVRRSQGSAGGVLQPRP